MNRRRFASIASLLLAIPALAWAQLDGSDPGRAFPCCGAWTDGDSVGRLDEVRDRPFATGDHSDGEAVHALKFTVIGP